MDSLIQVRDLVKVYSLGRWRSCLKRLLHDQRVLVIMELRPGKSTFANILGF
jgi:hypothetical protein